jgi:hypothetical protein
MSDYGYPPDFPPEEEEVQEEEKEITIKDKSKGKKVRMCYGIMRVNMMECSILCYQNTVWAKNLLVRLGYLNGKFTCPKKKKSLVQIINNLLGQFELF